MATIDWSECALVEVIPGKVSGVPLLKNTRLPVEAITSNYNAFRAEGLSSEAAIIDTLPLHPSIPGPALTASLDELYCVKSR